VAANDPHGSKFFGGRGSNSAAKHSLKPGLPKATVQEIFDIHM
jgi:hypothetical protein